MPLTYSTLPNTPHFSNRLASIEDVLNELPDNTNFQVFPQFIRDAVFSTWENPIFKQTTGSANIEYIGIDNDNIYTPTATQLIYFGKKKLIGNNSYGNDVINSTLLNNYLSGSSSAVDIFFFNTKSDYNPSLQDTKLTILAGTNSSLFQYAPYISSLIANGLTSSQIQLYIGNNSGNINISSNNLFINGIKFPNGLSASNANTIIYNNGTTNWGYVNLTTSNIGTSSSPLNISGTDVSINGYSIELTSPPVINPIGSVLQGKSFNKYSIVEVVKEMLYSYIPPTCELSLNSYIGEKGNPNNLIEINWTINKGTNNVTYANFTSGNVLGFVTPAPLTTPGVNVFNSSTPTLGLQLSGFTSVYTFNVSDSNISNSTSVTYTSVYPYYCGYSSTNFNLANSLSIMGSVPKYVVQKSTNMDFSISGQIGSGYVYFMYPVNSSGTASPNNGLLTSILDQHGITQSFTYSYYSLTSPDYYWSAVPYIVYTIPYSFSNSNNVSWNFNY